MKSSLKTTLVHVALYAGLPLGIVMAAAVIARAYDTAWIAGSQPVSASKLKADLDEIATRLGAVESAATVAPRYSLLDLGGNYVAVPGSTALTGNADITTTAASTLEITASGTVIGDAATGGGVASCLLTVFLDGVPITSTWALTIGPGNAVPFSLLAESTGVAAGIHHLAVQVQNNTGAGNPGCRIDNAYHTRFFVISH